MHVLCDLIPRHVKSCSVSAKHRARRILYVFFRVIAGCPNNLLLVLARLIALNLKRNPSSALCISQNFTLIITHSGHRGTSGQYRHLPFCLRRTGFPMHSLDVRHRPSDKLCGYFQPKQVIRLKQDTCRLHKPMPYRAVSRLPEISTLRML